VLVDDRPLDQGDVALFKIDTPSPLPVLVVSTTQPATGQQVDAVGYPGNVTSLVSGNPEPTFAQGQVSGRQQTDGGPFTQIGVAMSPGMSGGPVVDGSADVIGTVSFGPSSDTQQLNFAAAPETIAALLSRNAVKNELAESDTQFRAGLNEYFSGKFHAAADDLGKALAANPDNAIAQQYQSKAIAAFPQENTTGWVIWVILGGVLLVVIVIVLILLLVLGRSRKRRRAAQAATAGVADAASAPAMPAMPAMPVMPAMPAMPALPADAMGGYGVSNGTPPAATPGPVGAPQSLGYAAPPVAPPAPVGVSQSVGYAAPPAPYAGPTVQFATSAEVPAPVAAAQTAPPAPAAPEYSPATPRPTSSAPVAVEDPAAESTAAPDAAPTAGATEPTGCANCGAANAADARFCAACGHPLAQ
jgi:hypothetical protein